MPPGGRRTSKAGVASAAKDKGRQLGLFESFERSPKKRRRPDSDDLPLEVEVTPHVYDAFTVKYLETEGTQRGFKSRDEEEDIRRSGASKHTTLWAHATISSLSRCCRFLGRSPLLSAVPTVVSLLDRSVFRRSCSPSSHKNLFLPSLLLVVGRLRHSLSLTAFHLHRRRPHRPVRDPPPPSQRPSSSPRSTPSWRRARTSSRRSSSTSGCSRS